MKYYSSFGLNDFIICLGYKGEMIKEYFNNYFKYSNDIVYTKNGKIKTIDQKTESWKITLVDTGKDTLTGGRLKELKNILKIMIFVSPMAMDGGNLRKLIEFHKSHKNL